MTSWQPSTPWQASTERHKPPVEAQDTQTFSVPAASPSFWQPTLQELRLSCRLSREQLAKLAGVRLCRIYWMENGIETPRADVLNVLTILSGIAHRPFRLEDIRGLRIRPNS